MEKRTKIDYDMPIGTLKRIPDFLPPPGELGIRDELNDPECLSKNIKSFILILYDYSPFVLVIFSL